MRQILSCLIIGLAKFILYLINLFKFGEGSTWPGHIVLLLNTNFISETFNNKRNKNIKTILVAGTNGKTTTVKLLEHFFKKKSVKVFSNETGANLLNGLTSTIIKNIDFSGKLNFEVAVFEVDENTLSLVLDQLKPWVIIILSLFRDQLDRYGEVNSIVLKWEKTLRKVSKKTHIFLNGDDAQLVYLGRKTKANVHFFGISLLQMTKREIPHDVDSIYCPHCSEKLKFRVIAYSHLGDFLCENCGFKRENVTDFSGLKIKYPLLGKYNIYNFNAVLLLLKTIFNISVEEVNEYFSDFQPAFGRQEEINLKARKIIFLLSKNPAGFNQSIETLNQLEGQQNVVLLLNDRIPDGRDISWIWDVDFILLNRSAKRIFVSGDRAFDMGIRLKYDLSQIKKTMIDKNAYVINENIFIVRSLEQTIDLILKKTRKKEAIFILPTYSAMIEIRKLLTGKKFATLNQ